MSLDRTFGSAGTGVVFRDTGSVRHILLLRDDGDEGKGVLFSQTAENPVPYARSVEVDRYDEARSGLVEALRGQEPDEDAIRAEIARIALCQIEGLKIAPVGVDPDSGQDNWAALIDDGDKDEDDVFDREDLSMEVDEKMFASGCWGWLVKPGRTDQTLIPDSEFWDRRLSVSVPLDSFRGARLLRQLADKTGDPAAAKMLEALDGLNLDAAEHALRAVGSASSGAVGYYGEESPESADRRQAADIYPLFAGMIARSQSLREAVRERQSLQAGIQNLTGLAPAALRRLAKVDKPPPVDAMFGVHDEIRGEDALGVNRRRLYSVAGRTDIEDAASVLSQFDPAWAPDSNESWEAFTTILGAGAQPLAMILDRSPAEIMRPSKGNWTGWMKSLARDAGYDDENPMDRRRMALAMSDAIHGVFDFSQRVLLPLAISSVSSRGFELPPASAGYVTEAFHAGMSVLCGASKNPLGSLLSFSRTYISRIVHIEDAVASVRQTLEREGFSSVLYPEGHWPPMFKGTFTHGGVTARCITSRTDLAREGREMKHCVGSYGDTGETGTGHFVSMTGPGPNDRSTLQFHGEVERKPRKAQHKSYKNRKCPDSHVVAREALRAAVKNRTLQLNPILAAWRRASREGMMEMMREDRWGALCRMMKPDNGVPDGVWAEWRGILGGRAAKSEHPGVLYRDEKVRGLVRKISPQAASLMEQELREKAVEAEKARQEARRDETLEPA